MQSTLTTVGRVLLAALFLTAGVRKILVSGFAGTVGYIKSKGLPAPEILAGLTIALEIGGGILLLLNRFTLPVGLAFAGFCLASAGLFHNFWTIADAAQYGNQLSHFLKNVALAGGFLFVAASASQTRGA